VSEPQLNEITQADLYEVLQVSPSADPEVIAGAYERLTKKYGSDPLPEVRERRQLLDQAYAVLSDPSRRLAYDAARRAGARILSAVPAGAGSKASAMPPSPTAGASRGVVACARDPEVQTALRCSRCDTPICPKCLVHTPVGARCRDCARISRSPVYTLGSSEILRAAAAAIILGVVMGLVWGFVLLPFSFGFFSIFLGAGLGYAFTRALEFSTGRKRGPAVVGFAVVGIGIAWGMQFLFVDPRLAMYDLLAVGVAIYFAYQNLR
jgi:hypothetical protein